MLVSYTPNNDIGILQTKLSNREGHEARRVGLEAMPLDEHIAGRHGERQACLKRRPAPMHHLFAMADQRQHGEHGLDEHTVLLFAALTQFEVAGIPLRGMEGRVAQDNHALFELANQPLQGVIRDIGGGALPCDDQTILVQYSDVVFWRVPSELTSRQTRLLLGKQITKEIFCSLPELESFVRIQDQRLHECLGLLTTRFPNGFDGEAAFRR